MLQNNRRLLVFLTLMVHGSILVAGEEMENGSIKWGMTEWGWNSTPENSMLKESFREFRGYKLGHTSLDEVISGYGLSVDKQAFDQRVNYSPIYVCYQYFSGSENLPGNEVVIFQSGPLGGWDRLTGITLTTYKYFKDESCANIRMDENEGRISMTSLYPGMRGTDAKKTAWKAYR